MTDNKFKISYIIDNFSNAIKKLLSESGIDYLFNAQERAIAGRFANILSRILEEKNNGLYVDIEYNRSGYLTKILCSQCNDFNNCNNGKCKHWVAPDIIFHQRGTNEHNIFFCEIKKSDSNTVDKKKIEAAISDLEYCYGIVIYKFTNHCIELMLLDQKNETKYCYDFSKHKLIEVKTCPDK